MCWTLLFGDAARRRQTSYDVATLLLMAPIDPWQNSIPIFGAAAFSKTKIDNFRAKMHLKMEFDSGVGPTCFYIVSK